MTRLYRLLLNLYPRQIRDEFGDEMLAVFSAAAHDGGGLWFLLRECGGVVAGAARERSPFPRVVPAILGLVIAAVLHAIAYRLLLTIPNAVSRVAWEVAGPDGNHGQLELGLMAVGALMFIVPFVVVTTHALHRHIDRRRLRPAR